MPRLRFFDSLYNRVCVLLAAIDLLKLLKMRPGISEIGVESHSSVEPSAYKNMKKGKRECLEKKHLTSFVDFPVPHKQPRASHNHLKYRF